MTGGDAAGEYDEDEQPAAGPLLPPDDRLWRHPSEIADGTTWAGIDPIDIRNRWLARESTRATAWTAGLVGALLATGIVLVGTHLATILTHAPLVQQTASNTPIPSLSPGTTVPQSTAHGYGLGTTLDAAVLGLGGATVAVHAFRGSTEIAASLGIVMRSDGMVVAAANALAGATSILVEQPHGSVDLVATVSAVDSRTGLAVLHVNGISAPAAPAINSPAQMTPASFALAITSAGGVTYAPGSVTSVDTAPKVGGVQLIDATETDLPAGYAPLGSPVVNDDGDFIGMVVGANDGMAVLAPGWLLTPVADELDELGAVTRGWMGINGATVATSVHKHRSSGVRVQAVSPDSAAARAGLKVGDVVMAIDASMVTSISALQGHLYADRPGTVVTIEYLRNHAERHTTVTLAGAHG